MTTVADLLIHRLADQGVRTVWGVVGDALNPITDAIRRSGRIDWVGVRHEEAGAFAASAQAQLSGTLGVCMGTVGPGSIHLLNGLYDAKKSHAPVLAICGQVPTSEMGTEMFQEVDNDVLFADVSVFTRTVTNAQHFPFLLEQAVNSALTARGVSVLTIPGDIGDLELPEDVEERSFARPQPRTVPAPDLVDEAVGLLDGAQRVTMLVGRGALDGREEVLALARKLRAPMVLTLKAKEQLEHDNPFDVGQSGLIGNPGAQLALETCDLLLMLGTDFPYRDWYPTGVTVVQVDDTGSHLGRRTPVDCALVGDAAATAKVLSGAVKAKGKKAGKHLSRARTVYEEWLEGQQRLARPDYDSKRFGILRKKVDNPDDQIRPEQVAAAVDAHAAADAVYTSDTGMSTVWLSRLVRLRAEQRLIGSYNLGSMANAMPQALGAQTLYPGRQVISFSGDGGLTMLLGDLMTAVTYELPIKVVVFNNGRLGMVKLEMEQAGLVEFGTRLDNPDLAAVARSMGWHAERVENPADVDAAVASVLDHDGPALLDAVTNPQEIAVPGKPSVDQAWGFAIAKIKETLVSDG
ncbi:Pyruvate oxidase [Serinicoccus hydrothermalis]|uniref:Pyruvate oxidase n=1 Tax=Serinicoccus hydrothermalis TaxID=1758689 RepID=A0A1B1N9L8_9MICO|nr:thiamine pyrophosphate-dependent enzyme [Serinicoccus hydrothermalis]ANS78132.1 Pyruvate oxidase [Serinicoccus hydrothermalis]